MISRPEAAHTRHSRRDPRVRERNTIFAAWLDAPDGLARISILLLLLVAFALRAYHLDFQSLWSDEGISVQRSSQSISRMLEFMPVEHVPGYFLLLHWWMKLTGQSDYALRFFSLWPSVLAVALIHRLAIDIGSRRAGLAAAAFLATGPFQVWYAQEVRMYSWLLGTGLLSNWFFWLMLDRPRWRTLAVWLGYVLSTTATIYLHYFGFLIPIAHTAIALVWLRWGRSRLGVRTWFTAGVVIFLLFLPWMNHALQLFTFSGWREPLDPSRIPWMLLRAYTVGDTMPGAWATWTPLVYLFLALFGIGAWYRRKPSGAFFLVMNLLVSVAVLWIQVWRNPDFHVRYTIFVSVPLLMLAAGGVAGLATAWWRWEPDTPLAERKRMSIVPAALIVGALVAVNGLALDRLYNDTSLHKPDFRSAAQTIQREEEPGDVILVDGPNPNIIFNHYYAGSAPVYDLRFLEEASAEELDAALTEYTAGATRAWELLLFRNPGPVQVWLATRGWAAAPSYHNTIRVSLYGLDDKPLLRREMNLAFGSALRLNWAGISDTTARRGQLVRVSTGWDVLEAAPDYKFSLRLLDGNGRIVENWDYIPQNWFAPTHVWVVGQPATDQHGLIVPETIAPGTYRVTLRLYNPNTGEAVLTEAGQDVLLSELEVTELEVTE